MVPKTDLILKTAIKEGKDQSGVKMVYACRANCKNLENGINLISRFFKTSHKNTNLMKTFVKKSNGGV